MFVSTVYSSFVPAISWRQFLVLFSKVVHVHSSEQATLRHHQVKVVARAQQADQVELKWVVCCALVSW